MNASVGFDYGNRPGLGHRFDFSGAFVHGLEFEEFDDIAGDAADVVRMIERDGSVAPEFGAFDIE